MKEENQPIKLECYTKANDVVREKIGFVLVPLRSIPFWNSRKLGTMKPHWYKLHGVAQESSRSNKPELLLSITIGDKSAILNETEKLVIFNSHFHFYPRTEFITFIQSLLARCRKQIERQN